MNFPLLRRLPLLAVLLTLGLPTLTRAATFNVPSTAYPTIQSGINAAQSGDTVLVADGTYTGPGNVDLDFGGRNITVKSVNGPTSTIIDCQGSAANPHRGVYFHNGEMAGATVNGFTVRNGLIPDSYPGASNSGGAIAIVASSPTITNCAFIGNTAYSGGGVEIFRTCSPTIVNCTFSGNTASAFGGAVNNDGATLAVTKCAITNNSAQLGGGIMFNDFSKGMVAGCTLYSNIASNGGGGGIEVFYSSVSVTDTCFLSNQAYAGGGIYNDSNSNCSLFNCTIEGNTASYRYGAGGVGGGTGLVITNCILWNDGKIETPYLATYSDIQGGNTGTGNINADPLFVNAAAGDLRLKIGSPCLGAGTPNGAPTTDLDGTPRPNPPSMGAYELRLVPTYTIVDLGTIPGGTISEATAVNNMGQVVGISGSSSDHAFMWQNGKMADLGLLPGTTSSDATSINDLGQVVGRLSNGRAFLWTPGGGMQMLPTDARDVGGTAAINNLGQIITVYPGTNPYVNDYDTSLLQYVNGQVTVVGDPTALLSKAINDVGQVATNFITAVSGQAILWDTVSGLRTPLGSLMGGGSEADGINHQGEVVGNAYAGQTPNGYYKQHAFLWDAVTGMKDLGTLGGDSSYAVAINSTGQIIGTADNKTGNRPCFVYFDGVMYDLSTLLDPVLGTNWVLYGVTGINDEGQIVGFGVHNGLTRGFLLTPMSTATPADPNKVDLTADGVSGNADGIMCDNLTDPGNTHDADKTKDYLDVRLTGYPGSKVGDTSVFNADGRFVGTNQDNNSDNNAGHAIPAPDGSGDVWYFPPDEFNEVQRPQNASTDITTAATRKVTLTVHFTATDGTHYVVIKPIILARPPVVLVHGINSSPASWAPLTGAVVTRGGTRIPFVTVDHSDVDNGNGPVELAAARLASRIATTLDQVHNRKPVTDDLYNDFEDYVPYRLADRRVDLIGWSYGGLIARWYISPADSSVSQSWYKRNNILLPAVTYGNDVRKLITLGSMWRGVPLCNYLNEATLVPVDNRVSLASAALNPGSQLLASLLTHDGLQLGSVRNVGDVVKVVGSHISVNVPSMDVMAVDSPWLSYLVFHDAFQQTQPNVPKPFADDVAYGSVAGDNNSYSQIWGLDTYTLLDDATNLGFTTPTTFPYLRLEQTPNAGRNYSDGIVPLWSSAIPGSYQIAPTDHSGYPDDQDAQNYLVQWLNNATLPTGKGFLYTNNNGTQTQVRGLNETWNDPSSWNDARYAVQSVNGKRWKFSPDHLAPYPEYDLYQQSDRTGRINPIALHEVKDIVVDPVTPGSAQITWITATDTDSLLWLWTKDGGGNFIGPTAFLPQGQSNATTKIHKVSATGLAPNTTYYYDLFSRWDAGKSDEIFLSTDANRRGAFTTPQDKPIINVTVAGKPTFVGNQITFSLQVSNTGTTAHGFRITGVTFGTIGFTPLPSGYAWYPFGNPITIDILGPPQTLIQTATKGTDTPNLLCSVKYQYYNAAGDLITTSKTNLRLR